MHWPSRRSGSGTRRDTASLRVRQGCSNTRWRCVSSTWSWWGWSCTPPGRPSPSASSSSTTGAGTAPLSTPRPPTSTTSKGVSPTALVKPIFHWKWGSRWLPNAKEIYTKKEMYMTNTRNLHLVPNATYIPLIRVGGFVLGDAKKIASPNARDTNMLVFFALGSAKVLSFALGDAKVPSANSFASQWNIGLWDWSLITGGGGAYKMGKSRVWNFSQPPTPLKTG